MTSTPLWVRNTDRPVDVPWFRWELSNRVPSSCPVRRIPRQDPLHTTGWESLTNGYTIIPKDKVKAESLLITEHSSHTSMCINNASLFHAYQSINWWQNSVHILLKLNDDSLLLAAFGAVDEPLASCMIVHFSAQISKWELVCKFGVIFHVFIISCLCSWFHVWNQWFFFAL